MNRLFLKGVKHGIPIALGYLSVSFTFGMKAVSDGLAWQQAVLISMTNVTSAGQLAGVPIIACGGSLLELALDRGVLTGGGREIPLCEVEVELKSGSREAVLAFAKELAQRFDLAPETRSKFRRALALAKGE